MDWRATVRGSLLPNWRGPRDPNASCILSQISLEKWDQNRVAGTRVNEIVDNSQQAGQGYAFSIQSHTLLLACAIGSKSVIQDSCSHLHGVFFVPYPKYKATNYIKFRQMLDEINWERALSLWVMLTWWLCWLRVMQYVYIDLKPSILRIHLAM